MVLHCRVGFKGNRVCLSGLKCKRQGNANARSAMVQEPVRTYLANKTKKGATVGAILGTKMSPRQASAVKEDCRKSSWATAEAMRSMGTRPGGVDVEYDAPASLFTPRRIELGSALNADVGSRTRDRAKAEPGLVKKIADPAIFNQSSGKSVSYSHADCVGQAKNSKSRCLLRLTSKG
jgi:hypothetical protein